MAQVKNFGIRGVGSNVQYGKGGGRLAWNVGQEGDAAHFAVYAPGEGTTRAQLRVPETPVHARDAASKGYVDSLAAGLDPKASVRVATTVGDGNLGTAFEANSGADGVGESITGVGASLAIDGVTLAANDRVLVKNQSDPTENGIYVYDGTDALVRATDFDGAPEQEVDGGEFTFVEEGTANADTGWVMSADGAVTFGTTPITFVQFSSAGVIEAGDGLNKLGNTLSVRGSTTILVDDQGVHVNSSTTAGQVLISQGGTGGEDGTAAVYGALNLGTEASTTGQLPQTRGGLGANVSAFADNSLLVKSGAGYVAVEAGAANTVLTSNGTSVSYQLPQTLFDDGGVAALSVDEEGDVILAADGTDPMSLVSRSYVDDAVGAANTDLTALQGELDATQTGAGLEAGGTLGNWATGSAYLAGATSLKDGIEALDTGLDEVDGRLDTTITSAGFENSGELGDWTSSSSAYINTTTNLKDAIEALDAGLVDEVAAREAAITAAVGDIDADIAALQAEVDLTQTGAGLNGDGSYTSPGGNYIGGATSLSNADTLLDTALDTLETRVDGLDTIGTDLQAELDLTQASVGLATDGGLDDWASTNYLRNVEESSLKLGIERLDASLASERAALQTNIDDTNTVIGLDGEALVWSPGVNYLEGMPTIRDGIEVLDAELAALEAAVAAIQSDESVDTQLTAIKTAVGLNPADGTFVEFSGTNYMDGATSIVTSLTALDGALFTALDEMTAENVAYVTVSGSTLTATNVQDAIEQLDGRIDDLTAADVAFDNTGTGMAATDVQGAIVNLDGRVDTAIQSNGTVAFVADQSMGGFKLTNLGTPTNDADAATKAYVDEVRDDLESAIAGGVNYRGQLDAGVDPLPGTPAVGDMYRIVGEGDFGGDEDFGSDALQDGDFIIWNGTAWDRMDSVDVTVAGTAGEITVDGNENSGYTISLDDAFVTRMTTAEGEIDTLQTDLTAVTGRVTTAEGEIDTLQGDLGDLTDLVDDVITWVGLTDGTGALPAFTGEYTGGSSPATTIVGAINLLDGELVAQDGRLDALEASTTGANNAQFLVLEASAGLENERVFGVGNGLTVTDGGAGAAYTVDLVVAGGSVVAVSGTGIDVVGGTAGQVVTSNGTTGAWGWTSVLYETDGTAAITVNDGGTVSLAVEGTDAGHLITKGYVDTAIGGVQDQLDNLSQSRIEDTSGNTYVDVEVSGDAEAVHIGSDGDLLAIFVSDAAATGGEQFVFTNDDGEVRIGATNTAGTGNVDIRLVPQEGGQVFIGEAGQNGTIQADDGFDLILLGGDDAGSGGGSVTIGGVGIFMDVGADLITVPGTYDPSGNPDALADVGYVTSAISTAIDGVNDTVGDLSNVEFFVATADASVPNAVVLTDGNGISLTAGTIAADVDGATITAAGGTGAQLAVRGGAANQTLVSAGGAADATWGYVSALRNGTGDAIFTASETGGARLEATGTATDISIVLDPKGAGYVVAPSGYDMSTGAAEAFSTKGYVDTAIENAVTTGTTGGVRSVAVSFTEAGGEVNLGDMITGRVFRVTVHVTNAFDAEFTIGSAGDGDDLVVAAEIDETVSGAASVADVNVNYGTATQLVAATGGAGAGTGFAIIEYVAA